MSPETAGAELRGGRRFPGRSRRGVLVRAVVAGGIRPVVDRVFPLAGIRDALRLLEAGDFVGKVGIDLVSDAPIDIRRADNGY